MQGYPPPPPGGYPPPPGGYGPPPGGFGPPPGGFGPPQAPNPYAAPYGQPPMGYGGMQPTDMSDGGNAVLIWGILGVAVCALCAPVAWMKGNQYLATCRAMGVQPSSAGTIGRVLGIIWTILLGLGFVGGLLSVCASALSH